MHLTIRQYRASDDDQVWKLHTKALKQAGAFIKGHGSWDDDLKDITGNYLKHRGEFLVVENENKIIAMGALRQITKEIAEIKRMRVYPKYQRRGIGQKILDMLENRASELGYSQILLDTTDLQTAAQRFYQKNGYNETHRQQKDDFEMIYYRKKLG